MPQVYKYFVLVPKVIQYQAELLGNIAGQCKWHVMQSLAHPLPSCALSKAGTPHSSSCLACNVVLESEDATK